MTAIPNLPVVPTNTEVSAWGGFNIPVVGTAVVDVTYRDKHTKATFYVVDAKACGDRARTLMSFTLCKQLGLIEELAELCNLETTMESTSAEAKIRDEFKDLFTGEGSLCTGDTYTITLSA